MTKRTFTASARKALLRRGRSILRGARGGSDLLGGLPDSQRIEIAEIHNALDRIERGIYGQCVGCSGEISEQQLMAKPEWTKCDKCTAPAEAEAEVGDSSPLHH